MTRTLEPIIAEHPFFRGLEKRYLELVAGCAANVRFDAGQFVFHQGEEANHLFLIRHGKVAVEISGPGRGPIVVQTLGEGDLLGWSWLVPPYQWHFDAQAAELTRAIMLDGKCLREKCDADHTLGYEFLSRLLPIVAARLSATQIQLMDVYGTHSPGTG
jgi:CRP-like cAMP-binding protein